MTPPPVATYWCESLLVDGVTTVEVRLTVGAHGRITDRADGVPAEPGDIRLGTVLPGLANAHSHAFHRALRGRTHDQGGDFWRWRESMYAVARALSPERYRQLARAVFAEMLVSGYTAVGEFHYLHHQSGGAPYPQAHAMELALATAAREVGIRLVLLDTSYLAGGINTPLRPEQRGFGDGSAAGWLARWARLRDTLDADAAARPAEPALISLGAALHSVRAVPREAMREILAGLPADVPLHIHLSEQPQENADCLAAYGLTPTELLDGLGALSPRLSVVHATHLSDHDLQLLGRNGVTVVMCPSTEADLGDGIGPARAVADAGSPIALGSDQNAVIDPFLELRGLEMGERLASGSRGRFTPAALLRAAGTDGYAALGLGRARLAPGDPADLVEVDARSIRTVGASPDQLVLAATAADVLRVIVAGRLVADNGRLVGTPAAASAAAGSPAALLRDALDALDPFDALSSSDPGSSPAAPSPA
ncbi:formimidoylglutamate deiminase [Cryobacterium zongtaii]|uniref:Formimidoylglutamate deiminase n=1 Tax=Cryobacterium zongtaii TaxID=1259217 RepID=A0A2S3ZPQ4_9MICO|nr:formimidoylglutamate deiminase [Cryobacterium zongtaii]POH71089.1 formimidoylglutamate deiminase [Cryobacterium zongtaii]